MCLAVPGRILSISCDPSQGGGGEPADEAPGPPADEAMWRMAEVDFGGVRQRVSLACLPDARVGDQVLVHVGFALSLVDDTPESDP